MVTRVQAVRCIGLLNPRWSPIRARPVLAPGTSAVAAFAWVLPPKGSRFGPLEDAPAAAVQAHGSDRQDLLQFTALQAHPEELPAHAKIRHCHFGFAGRQDSDVLESMVLVSAGDPAAAFHCQPPDHGVARPV